MRILFATTSGAGHFGPLIPFAHACRRAGHQVLVAGHDGAAALVQDAGLRFRPVAEPSPEDVARFNAGQAGLSAGEAMMRAFAHLYLGLKARAALPGMAAAIEEWRPDVVVRETAEVASMVAAERLAVPHARVEIALSSSLADEAMRTAAPVLDELRMAAGLAPGARRHELCLTLAPASLDGAGASAAVRRFRDPLAAWAPSLWGEWGDPEHPLVLLSFGTEVPSRSRDHYPGLYRDALHALAEQPLRILVSTGGRDPGELGPVPAAVRVERWVPQAAVLRDAALMVGHGGAGSTLSALVAGVPMALLPHFADQPFNARRIAALGLGIELTGVAEMGDAVRRLLSFEVYRDRARRVRDEIQALPPVDTAVDLLMDVADGAVRKAA